jgi:hypothetical protein
MTEAKERLHEYVQSEEKDPEVAMYLIGQANDTRTEQRGNYEILIGRFDDLEVTAGFRLDRQDELPDVVGYTTVDE